VREREKGLYGYRVRAMYESGLVTGTSNIGAVNVTVGAPPKAAAGADGGSVKGDSKSGGAGTKKPTRAQLYKSCMAKAKKLGQPKKVKGKKARKLSKAEKKKLARKRKAAEKKCKAKYGPKKKKPAKKKSKGKTKAKGKIRR
jgi:hypothetical protein